MNERNSLPLLGATIFALLGDMSGYVPSLTENEELSGPVPTHTLRVPPRPDPAVPIRSDQITKDGPSAYSRGVIWSDIDFSGYRTICAHNDDGKLVYEARMPAECADAASERIAWMWLNDHFPKAQEAPPFAALRLI